MKTLKKYQGLFVFLLLFIQKSYSQEIDISSETKLPINATSSMEIFRDSSNKVNIEDISTQNFKKNSKDYFIFPYSGDSFWVRLKVRNNDSKNKSWVLKWNNPLVELLDFYVSDSTQKNYLHTQQKLITTEREKKLIEQEPRFSFNLSANTTKIIYIKVSSQRGQYGTISIHSDASMLKHRFDDYTDQAFTNGLVIFRLFLVLTLSLFIIKDLAFRIYSLHTILKTLAYWGIMNITGPLFTANPDFAKKIDFLSYNSISIGSGLFILVTFANKLPKWNSILIYFILGFTILIDTIVFFDYKWYWLKAGLYNIVFSSLYFFVLYFYCFVKKIPVSKYYAIPFLLGLLSYFLINIRLLGWIEYKPIFMLASLLFVAEIFVFVIFLGQIFRKEEKNKQIAEQKLSFNVEQNNRLKELDNLKTTFFTNISHELRTPLTLIIGPLKELLERYPKDNLIKLMERNSNRLLTLVNQLLDISKLEAGQMKPELSKQNITKYFKTLTSAFSSLAESKEIEFEITLNPTDVWGYIDTDKIDKIITNLLSNAFKFTPAKGKVEIKSKYLNNFKQVSLEITDTGIGIEKEKLDKIFDRFYQVDDTQNRKFEGTGIGLALVKELVEVLKGKITVMSKKDIGTTFNIILPIDAETWKENIVNEIEVTSLKSQTTIDKNLNAEPGNTTKQVDNEAIMLIVDDNEDIRTYIKSIFESEFQIIEAVNGKDGIEKATTQIPDIIISDLMMPEMDGFEFCKALKSDEKTSHIPIVMLTAKANVESRIVGFELGADDYLIKPFNSHEMQARVKNLLCIREKLRKYFQKNKKTDDNDLKVNIIDEQFIKKIKETIEAHLADSQFSIEQLADEVSLSTTQLRRKIKALSNQTIVEFIRIYRLEKAAKLLSQNAGNVSEIAFNVGFDSLSYFSKVFQETYGVLPSDFRENNLK